MAKYSILVSLLVVGGLAFPASRDDGAGFDDNNMSIFFDETVPNVEGRIVGGTVAAAGAHPWIGAMTNGVNRNFLCGGSIATVRHVITAAHCIKAVMTGDSLSSTLRITVGTNRWNYGGQTYSLRRHACHPEYNEDRVKNDIGILFTTTNIVLSDLVMPIPLDFNYIRSGTPTRVAGYGRTRSGGSLTASLMEYSANVVDGQTCIEEIDRVRGTQEFELPPVEPAVEICTFIARNRGTCNGDSGSPLVHTLTNRQIGIVSWGLPCARGVPDVFVRLSAFQSWIQREMH